MRVLYFLLSQHLFLYCAAAAAKSLQSCPTLCDPIDEPIRLPHPWDSLGKNTGVGCHCLLQCVKVKSESEVAQSCLTLGDPMDCSLPGSSIHGIFQARVLEWGAIAFSKGEERLFLLTFDLLWPEVSLKLTKKGNPLRTVCPEIKP